MRGLNAKRSHGRFLRLFGVIVKISRHQGFARKIVMLRKFSLACALLSLGDGRQRSQRGAPPLPQGASPGGSCRNDGWRASVPISGRNIDYELTSPEQD